MGNGVCGTENLYGFKFREPDRRRGTTQRRFDIKQLWQRSHEILNLALLGHKSSAIAEMLDIHPVTVSNTLNSTLGKEAISEKRKTRDSEFEELQDKVMELTKRGLEIYDEMLNENEETGRVSIQDKKKVADTVVLELSGLRAPTRVDTRSIHSTATLEEIEEFKKRGIAASKANGRLVTVENEGKRNE